MRHDVNAFLKRCFGIHDILRMLGEAYICYRVLGETGGWTCTFCALIALRAELAFFRDNIQALTNDVLREAVEALIDIH